MRFCPYCGAPVVPAGKFCVECGRQLEPSGGGRIRGLQLTAAFVGVFLGMLIVGMVVVYLVVPLTPSSVKMASLPAEQPPSNQPLSEQPPSEPSRKDREGAGKLPPGHPKVELPAEARSFIDEMERTAKAKPNDIAAWNRFGEVALRAAQLDPSYYPKAEQAYAHALKLNPDNPDALRGIGNLNYDHKNYDQAIAAYEHYLKQRADDAEVLTDLGTMYLYTGNPDQAVVQYKKAIKGKPNFFEAYYNLGIAYAQENDSDNAHKSFEKALALAPDDGSRSKVQQMIGKLAGRAASASGANQTAGGQPPAAMSTASAQSASSEGGAAGPASGDFHGAIEQMVRSIPFAGPKVQSVKWHDNLKATVLMDNFPMDQMPPFAKQKFLGDLKDRIKTTKGVYNIKDKIQVDLADAATGQVMESVSQ
jgi:tetratricopeptide (TPR) repeat protein